jgi:hypothetical protein
MRKHLIDQLIVGQGGIVEPETTSSLPKQSS